MIEDGVLFDFLKEENQDFPSERIFEVNKNWGIVLIEDNL